MGKWQARRLYENGVANDNMRLYSESRLVAKIFRVSRIKCRYNEKGMQT